MRRHGCRKRRYRDRVAALFALSQTRRRQRTTHAKEERRAYRCPACGGAWHLTSRPAA